MLQDNCFVQQFITSINEKCPLSSFHAVMCTSRGIGVTEHFQPLCHKAKVFTSCFLFTKLLGDFLSKSLESAGFKATEGQSMFSNFESSLNLDI